MAIADLPQTSGEASTEATHALPRVPDRERRRASATLRRLDPGRYLAVEDGDDVIVLPLARDVTHLGRSPSADIVLDDASVSRRHAVVARRGGKTVVLDDRSLNGVRVNGVRCSEAVLADGDVIVLGSVVLRYVEVRASA